MQYFVQLNTGTGTVTLADPLSLSIEYDVTAFDIARFSFPSDTLGFGQFRTMKVIRCDGETDTVLFDGFVYSITAGIETLEIECRSKKALFYKKLVLSDLNIAGSSLATAGQSILDQWNTAYSDAYTFSTDAVATVTKTFSKGDTLFDALDELAGLSGCVWDVQGTTVRMSEMLGTDRSVAGSGYVLLAYDKQDPFGSNARDVSVKTYSTISNVIIASDGTSKSTASDATSRAQFGPLGEYKTFRKGSLTAQLDEYLALKKTEQKVISVGVEYSGPRASGTVRVDRNLAQENGGLVLQENGGALILDKPEETLAIDPLSKVRKGDKVKLEIRNCGEYVDFEGSVIVNSLTLSVENLTERITLGLSDTYAKVDSLSKTLSQISAQTFLNSL